MNPTSHGVSMKPFQIADVRVWPERNCVRVNGREVHLEPKVMALLLILAKRPDEVVSRQELLDEVWTRTVVGEEVLTRCVSELRAALGDQASAPTFVQTVPKCGYRLLHTPQPVASKYSVVQLTRKPALGALLVVMASTVAWFWYVIDGSTTPFRIAVVPFLEQGSPNYFGEGLAEEILNTLVTIPDLQVASRTSSFSLDPERDPQAIGQALSVDAVLIGTLARHQDQLQVAVQLFDVDSGLVLWAKTYEGQHADLFGIQDEVVASVVSVLDIDLKSPLRVVRPTSNLDALELYLLGRHHWHQRTASSLDRAIDYFSQALDRDPSLALAHSGLADAYLLKASYGDLSKKEAQVLAVPSIERALELDPDLADARASLGIMRLYEGSLELAEASLVEATQLNPYHTMALMWLGNVLQEQGRISDAHDPYSRAYALDPEHPTIAENFVNSLLLRGDNAQAREVLAGARQSLGLVKLAAMTALEQGDWERASAIAETLKSEGEELAAHLILWRLYTKRSEWLLAADELKISETIAPESVDVYLTALEHLALTEEYGVLLAKIANWSGVNPAESDKEHKVSVIEQAWRGIALARGGRFEEAATLLRNVLGDSAGADGQPATLHDGYPPFRLMIVGYLLTALESMDDQTELERWRTQGLKWLAETTASGWGSFDYRLQEAYFLSAAGHVEQSLAAFSEVTKLGVFPRQALQRDPRAANILMAGASLHELTAGDTGSD